jgi:Tol biopolymer transport system component
MFEFRPASIGMDVWEIKVDPATGKPLSEGRRITQWSTFASGQLDDVNVTADGKTLVARRGQAQGNVYVAEVEPGGKAMKNPRVLTNDESDDAAWGWTADSRAVLFASNRNGNNDLFKQDIRQREAESIVVSPENESHPMLSPDGAFILYLVSEKSGSARLMRIPIGGGPPELVLRGEKIKSFSCARAAKRCVVVEEEVEEKQVLTTFDPLKGKGERLLRSDNDYSEFGRGILSPQGRLIEKWKWGPDGLHIRVRSLTGGSVEEFTFKSLTGEYGFLGWSPDEKGLYVGKLTSLTYTAFYVGLDGDSQLFWKLGMSPGYSIDYPIPSPDGRHLAFTATSYESNAWLLEHF